jgi:hypothetical protein
MLSALLFVMHHHVMGFSEQAAKHTFRLFSDGGAIEVRALDDKDAQTVAMIRSHLQTIAKEFAAGNFAKPQAVHDRMPDGAEAMKEMQGDIRYDYGDVPGGGRVRITASNARALSAIHDYLRFQIREHKTGDPITTEGMEGTKRPM